MPRDLERIPRCHLYLTSLCAERHRAAIHGRIEEGDTVGFGFGELAEGIGERVTTEVEFDCLSKECPAILMKIDLHVKAFGII